MGAKNSHGPSRCSPHPCLHLSAATARLGVAGTLVKSDTVTVPLTLRCRRRPSLATQTAAAAVHDFVSRSSSVPPRRPARRLKDPSQRLHSNEPPPPPTTSRDPVTWLSRWSAHVRLRRAKCHPVLQSLRRGVVRPTLRDGPRAPRPHATALEPRQALVVPRGASATLGADMTGAA